MGDGRILLNPDATIPLKKSHRMSLISAGSISLDSTFNKAPQLVSQFQQSLNIWMGDSIIKLKELINILFWGTLKTKSFLFAYGEYVKPRKSMKTEPISANIRPTWKNFRSFILFLFMEGWNEQKPISRYCPFKGGPNAQLSIMWTWSTNLYASA